ncbi:MAG: hypothetical protein IJY16_09145 [Clostridia bacterium]|nr:hypothetical protein [Clostridia bacterium]
MTNSSPSPKGRILLCEECTHIQTLRITYRLHYENASLLMTISDGTDVRAADLGTALRAATRFFFAVVDGRVTPCTFFDVLEDADEDGVFQKIPLQSANNML